MISVDIYTNSERKVCLFSCFLGGRITCTGSSRVGHESKHRCTELSRRVRVIRMIVVGLSEGLRGGLSRSEVLTVPPFLYRRTDYCR